MTKKNTKKINNKNNSRMENKLKDKFRKEEKEKQVNRKNYKMDLKWKLKKPLLSLKRQNKLKRVKEREEDLLKRKNPKDIDLIMLFLIPLQAPEQLEPPEILEE